MSFLSSLNFLNFTPFKNMITRMKQAYYRLKLRKKALVLYLLFGTCLTIPLAAISSIFLMHYLTSEEQKNLDQTLSQSVSQIESDLSLYTALSDYCFNNTELASIINQTYTDNYFTMYKVLEDTIIPTFRTYQLLHPNLRSIRLYTDCGLPAYKKYIYPLELLEQESWFYQVQNSYQPVWIITDDHRLLSVRKLIDSLSYQKTNYLCIEANFNAFFSPLSSILSDGTGVFAYTSDTLDDATSSDTVNDTPSDDIPSDSIDGASDDILSENSSSCSFFTDSCGLDTTPTSIDGLKADYLYASCQLSCGWTVYYYRSIVSCHRMNAPAIAVLWALASLLMTLLFCCTYLICGTLIEPIEKLSRKVQAVTAAGSHAPLKTRRTDEIGDLTRHFNQMVQQVYQNKLQINEYRLKALYAQINPHFLYNTLGLINNKAIMAEQDEISHMTLLLSQFYRTCLNHGKDITTIEKELENIRLYLEIQQITYHHNFEVLWQLDSSLYAIEMPNFILQPIVENAIAHGLRNDRKKEKQLSITLERYNSDILFAIHDNGLGMEPEECEHVLSRENEGIGLKNIHDRLQICYGIGYGITIFSEKHIGTTIYVRLADQIQSNP